MPLWGSSFMVKTRTSDLMTIFAARAAKQQERDWTHNQRWSPRRPGSWAAEPSDWRAMIELINQSRSVGGPLVQDVQLSARLQRIGPVFMYAKLCRDNDTRRAQQHSCRMTAAVRWQRRILGVIPRIPFVGPSLDPRLMPSWSARTHTLRYLYSRHTSALCTKTRVTQKAAQDQSG